MKKIILVILLALLKLVIVTAQTITITGNIKGATKAGLPFVLIQDKIEKSATYSDSAGNFNIKTVIGSTLTFSRDGYLDQSIVITNNQTLSILLINASSSKSNTSDNAKGVVRDITTTDAFSGHINMNGAYNTSSSEATGLGQASFNNGSFVLAKEKEEAHGSRYFFSEWGEGSVINSKDILVKDSAYVFNYDKIDGSLIVTHDKKNAMTIDNDQIKSFIIYNENKEPVKFERFPTIDERHFMQIISEGTAYKILKLTKTKFIKANYTTNGIVSSGNQYDEYVDETNYFLLNAQTNKATRFLLKKKSIKESFGAEANKADTFLKEHKDDFDDQYLKNLGDYMNK